MNFKNERIDVEYPCNAHILIKKQYYNISFYYYKLIRLKGEYLCYNCCSRCDTVSIVMELYIHR